MTDEQENVENKKDEKYKKNEKNGNKTGYYVKRRYSEQENLLG